MKKGGDTAADFSSRPHVMVVDDDRRIRELVSRFLTENGFVVVTAESAARAREMLKHFTFDALVVDVMMPGESGIEFTQYMLANHKTPVLLLTALGEAGDRIRGLEAGADDYLSKPFEPRELVLRLNAILRRTAARAETLKPFRIGRWRFDPAEGELKNEDGSPGGLTAAENTLIRVLALRPGEPVSREELAEKCGLDSGGRSIDVQVTRLRRKIEEDSRYPRWLKTVRGKGYMLRVEDL